MRNVGEGAAVDKGGIVFQGLHQVGLNGVFQQGRHGAGDAQIGGGDRLFFAGMADGNLSNAAFQIAERIGQAQDGHDFGSDDDVKAVSPRKTVADPP